MCTVILSDASCFHVPTHTCMYDPNNLCYSLCPAILGFQVSALMLDEGSEQTVRLHLSISITDPAQVNLTLNPTSEVLMTNNAVSFAVGSVSEVCTVSVVIGVHYCGHNCLLLS